MGYVRLFSDVFASLPATAMRASASCCGKGKSWLPARSFEAELHLAAGQKGTPGQSSCTAPLRPACASFLGLNTVYYSSEWNEGKREASMNLSGIQAAVNACIAQQDCSTPECNTCGKKYAKGIIQALEVCDSGLPLHR